LKWEVLPHPAYSPDLALLIIICSDRCNTFIERFSNADIRYADIQKWIK